MADKPSDDSQVFFLLEDDKKSGDPAPEDTVDTGTLKLEDIDDDQFSIELDFQKFGIVKDERRKAARVPYWGKVFIHDKDTQKTIKAQAKDITEQGVGLTLQKDSIELGKEVIIEFPGSGDLKAFSVEAKVVNITMKDGKFIFGFTVTNMSTLTHKKIQNYIEETINSGGFSDTEVT